LEAFEWNFDGSTQANDRTALLPDGQSRPYRQSLKYW